MDKDPLRTLAMPKIIGHRGAAAHAPENTLAALRRARDLGASWVEFDVRLTADGRCVLLHDDLLDRTTDGSGAVADATLDHIAALDAGGWFDPAFRGEPVPTLEEAIDLLEELGLGANIEIKPHDGAEIETAEAICRIVEATWPQSLPAPLLSSFAMPALETAHRMLPSVPRGLLLEHVGEDWQSLAGTVGARAIHCDHARLTAARTREIRRAGYAVMAYTVNYAGRAAELLAWGVNALCTDSPDQLCGVT
jgi:glycerophosphoryl diester phosphodiesterase